uniref:Transmembrane protein n=1 Tax=Romanomermis culicivorax TaxID=13658 RepID=A0A915IWA6_ROMCU
MPDEEKIVDPFDLPNQNQWPFTQQQIADAQKVDPMLDQMRQKVENQRYSLFFWRRVIFDFAASGFQHFYAFFPLFASVSTTKIGFSYFSCGTNYLITVRKFFIPDRETYMMLTKNEYERIPHTIKDSNQVILPEKTTNLPVFSRSENQQPHKQ